MKKIISFITILVIQSSHLNASCHIPQKDKNYDTIYPAYSTYTGLGTLENPFKEKDIVANSSFENGLKLLHLFEYNQARYLFKIAQKFNPENPLYKAIEMFSYHEYTGDNIVFNKTAQKKSKAIFNEIKNLEIKDHEERDFLNALKSMFSDKNGEYANMSDLNVWKSQEIKFRQTMCGLIKKYPKNLEIMSFCGLGFIDSRNGGLDYKKNLEGLKIINQAYKINPKHPGVLHYMIHLVENPQQAHLASEAATLNDIAFNAVHGAHMPAHYYYNIGDWDSIINKTYNAWDLGKKMNKLYNLDVGSIDNFHAKRWITYSYMQKGEYQKALDQIKDMVDSKYSDNNAIGFEFIQATANALIEGDFNTKDKNFLFNGLESHKNDHDSLVQSYISYGKMFDAYRNNNKKLFIENKNSLQEINKIIQDSQSNQSPMIVHLIKIMSQQSNVYNEILNNNLNQAEKEALIATQYEDQYAETSFETGPVMHLVPSYELLGEVLILNNKPADAKKAFDFVKTRYPNRLLTKKYLEKLNREFFR